MVILQLCPEILTQRNFLADYIRHKLNFIHRNGKLAFEPTFGGLEGNVCPSSMARWSARGQLPICHN